MVSSFFKIAFGFVALICLVSLIIAFVAMHNLGAGSDFPYLFLAIVGGIGFWIYFRSKNRAQEVAQDNLALIEMRKSQRSGNGVRLEGLGAAIDLRRNDLIISRHGTASFFTQGIKGDKTIPFSSITAVQFKNSQRHMSGYIQFSIHGEIASARGIWNATLDENTVMFTFEQAPAFEKLRNEIEAKIGSDRASNVVTSTFADELTKLADLRDRGVLDDSEFQEQKAKLRAATS